MRPHHASAEPNRQRNEQRSGRQHRVPGVSLAPPSGRAPPRPRQHTRQRPGEIRTRIGDDRRPNYQKRTGSPPALIAEQAEPGPLAASPSCAVIEPTAEIKQGLVPAPHASRHPCRPE